MRISRQRFAVIKFAMASRSPVSSTTRLCNRSALNLLDPRGQRPRLRHRLLRRVLCPGSRHLRRPKPQVQQVFPSNPMGPASSPEAVFADTPFAAAPPAVQRNVIVSAQIALARYGLYREQIDGIYGPAM